METPPPPRPFLHLERQRTVPVLLVLSARVSSAFLVALPFLVAGQALPDTPICHAAASGFSSVAGAVAREFCDPHLQVEPHDEAVGVPAGTQGGLPWSCWWSPFFFLVGALVPGETVYHSGLWAGRWAPGAPAAPVRFFLGLCRKVSHRQRGSAHSPALCSPQGTHSPAAAPGKGSGYSARG